MSEYELVSLLVGRVSILGAGVDLGLHLVEFEKGGDVITLDDWNNGIDHLLLVEIESDRGRMLNHCWGHWQGLVDMVQNQLIHPRVWLINLVHLL